MNMRLKSVIFSLLIAVSAMAATAYSIYPTPRNMALMGSTINLGTKVNIVTSDASAKYVDRLKEVLEGAGLSYTVSAEAAQGMVDVYIGEYGTEDVADTYSKLLSGVNTSIFPATTDRYDPHILRIDTDSDRGTILLLGDTDGSAYYACASLEQMLEQKPHSAMPTVKISDYAHAKYRGIMEGFYGHPYSMESRLNLLEYCKRYKMNYYGYGPKSDPYHAGNWRLNYPETVTDTQRNLGQLTSSDMATIAAKAKECNVDFVWIIHPSLGSYSINLSWVSEIMTKFEHLYSLGVRHFGVSVDDMSGHPSNQGELAHQVQLAIDEKWNKSGVADADRVGPVLFTPTVYALNYGASYVLRSMSSIDSKIDIAFTGYDCFSNVRAESFSTMANYIGRDPVFWWNNPVNDDYDGFLYLHGLTARWFIEQKSAVSHMKGFLLNPMNQGQASKVCLFSGADYAWNPEAFDEQSSWEASLRSIVKTDENVEALRDFIRVMSAYVTRDTKTPEGEEYAELYAQFKDCITGIDQNGVESLDEVKELYTIMTRTIEACDQLLTMADSEDEDCRLFLNDIEPWLQKVREMASIIVDTFNVLQGNADYDNWTQVNNIVERAAAIHTNHTISVLEGSGTSTYETFKEVQPTPKHLDALIDYIAQMNLAVTLPQRNREPEVISNFAEGYERGTVALNATSRELTLSGYGPTFDWESGTYLGINFNRLQSICASEIESSNEFSELQLQYSVNGKSWHNVPADVAENFEAAYIRYVNANAKSIRVNSGGEIKAPLALMEWEVEDTSGEFNITATTNMGTYSTYNLDNILDNNPGTFYWSNRAPTAGSYITLNLGTLVEVTGISLVFTNTDQPSGVVILQTSKDGEKWNDKVSFTKAELNNNKYTVTFQAEDARYVRMYLSTVTTGEWLQVADFGVTVKQKEQMTDAKEAIAVASDDKNQAISALDDRSLTTSYAATSSGYLLYKFTENLKIDEVLVFHNSRFNTNQALPTISVFADGQWRDCGVLESECTHVATADMLDVAEMKITWDGGNLPEIYEIMPIGEPYDANKHHAGIGTIVLDDVNGIGITTRAGVINISANSAITSITIYDISGRVLAAYNGGTENSVAMKLPLNAPSVVIVNVTASDGNARTERVALFK